MTLDEGIDPIDGSEVNAVRRHALDLMVRGDDDLSDVELMGRMTDEHWFQSFCLDTLHRLPSEVEPRMGCREYTAIKAGGIVRRAIDDMQRTWRGTKGMSDAL